ncbi:MAG: CBS domain-containing protein, partial [Candidatus Woesearchaeota archaeon]|nr:CBS domain-containing protein [Candidatus Woesearchaeota archaeon]
MVSVAAQTMYYGQVLLKDTPYPGVEVTAHWTDTSGTYKEISEITLDKREAYARGNSNFLGYYFFEKGVISPKTNTNIIFTFDDYPYYIIIDPAKSSEFRLNTISFVYGNIYPSSQADDGNVTIPENISNLDKEDLVNLMLKRDNATGSAYEGPITDDSMINNDSMHIELGSEKIKEPIIPPLQDKEKKKPWYSDIFLVALILLSMIGIVFISYLVIRYGIGYIASAVTEIASQPESLGRKFMQRQVKGFASQIVKIAPDEKLVRVLERLRDSELVFVVRGNACLGYIHRRYFLNADIDLEKKVADIVYPKENLAIGLQSTVSEAYSVMRKERVTKLCISDNQGLVNEVNLSVIQKAALDLPKLPGTDFSVRDIADKEVNFINKGKTVDAARRLLKDRDAEILVVMEDEKPIGIFTLHDYIVNYAKYQKSFMSQLVESVMISNFAQMDADADMIEANRLMVSREFKHFP